MLKILEQSLSISVDFINQSLHCISQYSIQLSGIHSSFELQLSAIQLSIISIKIINNDKVNLINYNYPKPSITSKILTNLMPEPESLDNYSLIINNLENGRIKSLNDYDKLNIFVEKKEENLETFSLIIEYNVIKPVAGVKFIEFCRSGNWENYLYSENNEKSAKYWIPNFSEILKDDSYIEKIKIIVNKGYMAILSGKLLECFEEEKGEKALFTYEIKKKTKLEHIGLCIGKFNWISKETDFFIFASVNISKPSLMPLLKFYEEMCGFIDTYEKNDFFKNSNYKFVLLPSFESNFKEKTTSFYGLSIGDENLRFFENHQKVKKRRRLFEIINKSVLLDVYIHNPSCNGWIIIGLNCYLADLFASNSETLQKLELSKTYDKFQNFVENGRELWPISSEEGNLLIGLWESDFLIKEKSRLLFHMISNLANCKKQIAKSILSKNAINSESFLKLIKLNFGVKKLKYFSNQFIKSTGMPKIDVQYNYLRKEKKIFFKLIQSPLQEQFFISYFNQRYDLETDKLGEPSSEIKFLRQEKKIPVPASLHSLRFFYGKIHIIVSETNEIDYKEEIHQLFLDHKAETKALINCHTQFRKTLPKKNIDLDESRSQIEPQSLISQSKRQFPSFSMQNSTRNPVLWLKIDPEIEFLSKISTEIASENVLLMQLTKEKDAYAIHQILKVLINFPSDLTVETLCTLLEKEIEFILKLEIVRTLLKITSEKNAWRGQSNLLGKLKKMTIVEDGSLKTNFLVKYEDYLMLKTIVEGLCKIKSEKYDDRLFLNGETIEIILKLLKESENNCEEYVDNLFKACLINGLLESNHPKYCLSILEEILITIKNEIAFPKDFQLIIIKNIIKKFSNFLFINGINKNLNSKSSFINKYNDIINVIFKKIKLFKPFFNGKLYGYYFIFKLDLKIKYYEITEYELLIKGIQKLEKIKNKTKNFCYYEISLHLFSNYISKNRQKLVFGLQKSISLNGNLQISSILWEQLTSGICLLNPYIQLHWIIIYREYFLNFGVLSHTNITLYKMNTSWFEEIKKKPEGLAEKKILKFQHLSINKRKRTSVEVTKLNPKDALITNLRKNSSLEEINWKMLSKCILTILMNEKMTENIERKFLNEEIDNDNLSENSDNKLKITIKSPLSFKLIKKKLLRNQYLTLEEVERDVYAVIFKYKKHEFIASEVLVEYEDLVESLFGETRKILAEVANNNFNIEQYTGKFKSSKIKLVLDGNELKFNSNNFLN